MESNAKPEWMICPHCDADLEDYGFNYECVHHIEAYLEANGYPFVKADRDLQNGTYYCGCCGEEISSSRLEKIDSADWFTA